ncbi:hypothetical protein ACFY5C_10255 [Streptomyces sp. NPDC012935]|uniref:hypothetical protein n=1 Tax=Streptomyces sp. NPDC012935 TaxID=3364857 RepID=UPI0036C56AAD
MLAARPGYTIRPDRRRAPEARGRRFLHRRPEKGEQRLLAIAPRTTRTMDVETVGGAARQTFAVGRGTCSPTAEGHAPAVTYHRTHAQGA